MRKSAWAAATGIASSVLLLTACGGSGSTSTAGAGTSSAAGSSSSATSTATAAATATGNGSTPSTGAHNTPLPQASGGDVSFNPIGTTVMVVQRSNLGFVLAEASGYVVYTYTKDTKGGAPTCTGACAATWPPVTGTPKAGPADTFPGTFGVVKGAGGVEQITYNGMPLYRYAGAKRLSTAGDGIGGVWHVVPLSSSDITGG